jgi:hypothetical protein
VQVVREATSKRDRALKVRRGRKNIICRPAQGVPSRARVWASLGDVFCAPRRGAFVGKREHHLSVRVCHIWIL